MTDYVFIGRRRHWARTLIYGVLTLGIYGRVLLHRQVKEIDGHRALFIDLRLIVFLLVLPLLGPFAVKMKVRRLVTETVEADLTQPPVRRRALFLLAFVPIVPLFHMLAQEHLNGYWRRQAKFEDLRHKRAELEKLQRGRTTEEKRTQVARLEEQIARRTEALDNEEEAARAIREARRERDRAERDFKESRRGPLGRVADAARARIPRREPKPAPEELDSGPTESDEPPTRKRFRALRPKRRDDEDQGPAETPAAATDPAAEAGRAGEDEAPAQDHDEVASDDAPKRASRQRKSA